MILGRLLRWFETDGAAQHSGQAYAFAGALVVSLILLNLVEHPLAFRMQHTGMRMRLASSSLLYQKVSSKGIILQSLIMLGAKKVAPSYERPSSILDTGFLKMLVAELASESDVSE